MARRPAGAARSGAPGLETLLDGLWRVAQLSSLAGLVPARDRGFVWISGGAWVVADRSRRPRGSELRCAIERTGGRTWLTITGSSGAERLALALEGAELRLGQPGPGADEVVATLVLRRARGRSVTLERDLPPQLAAPALGPLHRLELPRPVYAGALDFAGRVLALRLAPSARPLPDLVRRASRLAAGLEHLERRAARFAGRVMLDLWNEAWRGPDDRQLKATELARRFTLVSLWVEDEETTCTLDDGDAFLGHRVHVVADRRGRLVDADL